MIFPSRIVQAREFRNLTQDQLAAQVGIMQGTLADIERGRKEPSEEVSQRIADALMMPLEFFQRDINPYFGVGTLEFRARANVSAKSKKHAHQYASIVFELATFLANRLTMPPLKLPHLDDDPERAAAALRSELGVSPNGPIPNLTDVLERAGVFVFALPPLDSASFNGLDGFSAWAGNGRKLVPSIFLCSDVPGDRARLTLAHEVGELTLSDMPPGRAREAKANAFAGALLLPADAVREELVPPFTIADFARIKQRYKVSIQAALMRARQLEVISRQRYHSLFQQLSSRGWRKQEPPELDVPFEKPRALYKMVELLYGSPIDFVKLAAESHLDLWFLKQLLTTHASRMELKGGKFDGNIVSFRLRGPLIENAESNRAEEM